MSYYFNSQMRPRTVCDSCRQRRRKCDGEQPCTQCLKKAKTWGTTIDCSYTELKQPKHQDDGKVAILARLEFLESKLKDLTNLQEQSIGTRSSSIGSSQSLSSNSTNGSSKDYHLESNGLIPHTSNSYQLNNWSSSRNPTPNNFQDNSMSYILRDDVNRAIINDFTNSSSLSTSINSTSPEQLSHFMFAKSLFMDHHTVQNPNLISSMMNFSSLSNQPLVNYSGASNIILKLHHDFLKSSQLFVNGHLMEGYQLIYQSIADGYRLHVFKDITLSFPDDKNIEIIPPIEECVQFHENEKLVINKLWALILQFDTYISIGKNSPFAILEHKYSHQTLHNPMVDWLLPSLDSDTGDLLTKYQLYVFRLLRQIRHATLPSEIGSSKLDIQLMAYSFHSLILQYFTSIPLSNQYFTGLLDFVHDGIYHTGFPDNLQHDDIEYQKMFLLLMVTLHQSILSLGVSIGFSLDHQFNSQPTQQFCSQDILVLCMRAYRYLLKLSINGNCDMKDQKMDDTKQLFDTFQVVTRGCLTHQVCDRVLIGLSVQPINHVYLKECMDIIKDDVYPYVSKEGWKWPIVSLMTNKLQASIRRVNTTLGLD